MKNMRMFKYLLLQLFVGPPLLHQLLNLDSWTLGYIIFLVPFSFFDIKMTGLSTIYNVRIKYFFSVLTVIFFIYTSAIIGFIFADIGAYDFDINRYFVSVITFIIFLYFGYFFLKVLSIIPSNTLHNAIKFVFYCHMIFGVLGMLGLSLITESFNGKPMFIYTEPSHWGLAIAPLYVYYISISPFRKSITASIVILGIAITVQSLVSVLVASIGVVLLVRSTKARILMVLVTLVCLTTLNQENFQYYTKRIPMMNQEDDNQANYSYLQGFEETYIALVETYGLGRGFQQMGVTDPKGQIAQVTFIRSGIYLNRSDGSAFVFKFLYEFGFVGILFLLFLLKQQIKSFFMLSYYKAKLKPFDILIYSWILSSVLYVYVRGGGYFSLYILFFLAFFAFRPKYFKQ